MQTPQSASRLPAQPLCPFGTSPLKGRQIKPPLIEEVPEGRRSCGGGVGTGEQCSPLRFRRFLFCTLGSMLASTPTWFTLPKTINSSVSLTAASSHKRITPQSPTVTAPLKGSLMPPLIEEVPEGRRSCGGGVVAEELWRRSRHGNNHTAIA